MCLSRCSATLFSSLLLTLPVAAFAAEPLRLDGAALDRITAGATTGADIEIIAGVPAAEASVTARLQGDSVSFVQTVLSRGDTGTLPAVAFVDFVDVVFLPNDTRYAAAVGAEDTSGSSAVGVDGQVITTTTPNSSFSIGIFQGRIDTTGTGTGEVNANGVADGDVSFATGNVVPTDDGGFVATTIAFALDIPALARFTAR